MYNRYVPQADGTFIRNRIPDQEPEEEAEVSQETPSSGIETTPIVQQVQEPAQQRTLRNRGNPRKQQQFRQVPDQRNVVNFLKQLLPQNFDTEDLMIVLLLLLMAGDNQDAQNTALLTLVIYLFL